MSIKDNSNPDWREIAMNLSYALIHAYSHRAGGNAHGALKQYAHAVTEASDVRPGDEWWVEPWTKSSDSFPQVPIQTPAPFESAFPCKPGVEPGQRFYGQGIFRLKVEPDPSPAIKEATVRSFLAFISDREIPPEGIDSLIAEWLAQGGQPGPIETPDGPDYTYPEIRGDA